MRQRKRQRYQQGYLYENHGAFFLRYYITANGKRVQKSELLHEKDDLHFSKKCPKIQALKQEVLIRINGMQSPKSDTTVVDFWKDTYLPFIEEHKKASTANGYKQIWNQHLQKHFDGHTLQEYRTHIASQFLLTLVKTQGLRTLNHIRSLMSGVFSHAVNLGVLDDNPCHGIKILGRVKQPKPTTHYTLEEAENIISALVDRVDCQLIMALSCFMGLRPSEIIGLQWSDFDEQHVHIRRAVVRGLVGTCKTPESAVSLPLVDRVRLFLNLWRDKCGNPTEG
jgi:integrase